MEFLYSFAAMFIRIPSFNERGNEVAITAEDDIYKGIQPMPRTAKEDRAFQAHWKILQPDEPPYPERRPHAKRGGNAGEEEDDDNMDSDE